MERLLMNLREIDRLVAKKVMGWRLKSFPGGGGGFSAWLNDDGKIIKYENDYTLDAQPYDFWRPTTNIADAWQVVEKLERANLRVLVKSCSVKDSGVKIGIAKKGDWFCNVINEDENGNIIEKFPTYSKTPALAICLSALKSMGVDIEEKEH